MKNFIVGFIIAASTLAACNNGADNNTNEKNYKPAIEPNTIIVFTDKGIINGYLQLKNALAADNGKGAATAANIIITELTKAAIKSLSKEQFKTYLEIADDIKENAEHIASNAAKIEHQREHFAMLSEDITDLVKIFGNGGHTLYKIFCPMYKNKKGASWLSETKEIKNPYLGKETPTCGLISEEIK